MLSLDKSLNYSKRFETDYIASPDVMIQSPSESKTATYAIRSISNLTVDLKNNSKLDFNLFIYYDQNRRKKSWSYTENTMPTQDYFGDIGGSDDMYSIAAKYSTDQTKGHSFAVYYSGMYGSLNNVGDYFLKDDNNVYNGYLTTDYSMRGHVHNLTFDGVSKFFDGKFQLNYGIYADAGFLFDDTYDYNYGRNSLQSSTRFNADEFNIRAYIRAEYNFASNHGMALDIGYNQTIFDYHSTTNGTADKANAAYGNFAPNFSYWFRVTNYRLNLRFTTAVKRPNYSELLPGKRYINNYRYNVGNPNLATGIMYDLKLSQEFWEFLSLDLFVSANENLKTNYMYVDDDGLIASTMANTSSRVAYEADLTIPFTTNDRKFYGSIFGAFCGYYFYNVNPDLGVDFKTKHTNFGAVRLNMYYDITKRLSVECSFEWRSRRDYFQAVLSDKYRISMGASYAFLKEKNLLVNFIANNFIGGLQQYDDNSAIADNYFNVQLTAAPLFQLSVSYVFNKGKEIKYRNAMGDFNRMTKQ